jgi:hypothetical protein
VVGFRPAGRYDAGEVALEGDTLAWADSHIESREWRTVVAESDHELVGATAVGRFHCARHVRAPLVVAAAALDRQGSLRRCRGAVSGLGRESG